MSDPINVAYFDALIDRINSIQTLDDLDIAAPKIMGTVNEQLSSVMAQIEKLGPLADMLNNIPTSPDDVVSWITDLANNLIAPIVAPIATLTLQQTAIAAKIVELETAIQNKIDELTPGGP